MKIYLLKLIALIYLVIITGNIFAQTKKFLVNVNQPPKEQCIVNGIFKIDESLIKIFPNPTHGEITISFAELTFSTKITIQVFSLDGRVLLSYEEFPLKSAFQKRIDLTPLSNGIYLFKVSGKDFLVNERVVLY